MEGLPMTTEEAQRLVTLLQPEKTGQLLRESDPEVLKRELGLKDNHPAVQAMRECAQYRRQLAQVEQRHAAVAQDLASAQAEAQQALQDEDAGALAVARARVEILEAKVNTAGRDVASLRAKVESWQHRAQGERQQVVRFLKEQATYVVEAAPSLDRAQETYTLYQQAQTQTAPE